MAKSKYAPALFEVINRQKNTGKLGVPKWWKGGPGGPQSEGGDPSDGNLGTAAQAETAGPDQAAASPIASASTAQATPAATISASRPAESAVQREFAGATETAGDARAEKPFGRRIDFRVESGRIQLALTPVQAAAICGGLLIVLIVVFEIGKGFSGTVADKNSGLTMLDQKPNASVLDSPAGQPEAPTPPRAGIKPPKPAPQPAGDTPAALPEQEVLKVGSHYVLFDSYAKDHLQSAQFVQKWLESEHKIRTVLRERKGRYWLVGTDVSGEKAACERYAERIKAMGPECSKALIKAGLAVYTMKEPMVFVIDR